VLASLRHRIFDRGVILVLAIVAAEYAFTA